MSLRVSLYFRLFLFIHCSYSFCILRCKSRQHENIKEDAVVDLFIYFLTHDFFFMPCRLVINTKVQKKIHVDLSLHVIK